LLAIDLLAAGGGIASTRNLFFVLALIGFAGLALWTIVVSVMMYRAAGSVVSETPASAT